jgi:hypothetical protein
LIDVLQRELDASRGREQLLTQQMHERETQLTQAAHERETQLLQLGDFCITPRTGALGGVHQVSRDIDRGFFAYFFEKTYSRDYTFFDDWETSFALR